MDAHNNNNNKSQTQRPLLSANNSISINNNNNDNDINLCIYRTSNSMLKSKSNNSKLTNTKTRNQVIQKRAHQIKKKIKNILRWFGFKNSHIFTKCMYFLFMISNLSVNAITFPFSNYCFYLNFCVLLFQFESCTLYYLAYKSVTKSFIEQVVQKLADVEVQSKVFDDAVQKHTTHSRTNQIRRKSMDEQTVDSHGSCSNGDDCGLLSNNKSDSGKVRSFSMTYASPPSNANKLSMNTVIKKVKVDIKKLAIHIFYWQILWCMLVMIPSYATGLLIFETPEGGSMRSDLWTYYVYFSNGFDFVRYLPLVFHIALVRSYHKTFPIMLHRLRGKLNVIRKNDDIWNKKKNNDDSAKNNNNILEMEWDHLYFIELYDATIRPYRIWSKQLSAWISIYFGLNLLSFIFFFLSVLSSFLGTDCTKPHETTYIYYIHYLTELCTFFISWVFLVWPNCMNQHLLEEFFSDVRSMANVSAIDKCAIDSFITSDHKDSPFAIYGIQLTFKRFFYLLYAVVFTVTVDVVTKAQNIDII